MYGDGEAMRTHGLAEEIDIASASHNHEGSYLGARELLGRQWRPTGIFVGADVVALGELEAVAEAGLSERRLLSASDSRGPVRGGPARRALSVTIEGETEPLLYSPGLAVFGLCASGRASGAFGGY